jgi:hypothetical protein
MVSEGLRGRQRIGSGGEGLDDTDKNEKKDNGA